MADVFNVMQDVANHSKYYPVISV